MWTWRGMGSKWVTNFMTSLMATPCPSSQLVPIVHSIQSIQELPLPNFNFFAQLCAIIVLKSSINRVDGVLIPVVFMSLYAVSTPLTAYEPN